MLLLIPRFASAQVNLVVNGGFDADASGWGMYPDSGYYDPLGGDPGGCFVLTNLISSINQTVAGLVPGLNYLVSGSYKYSGTTEGSLGVIVAYDIFLIDAAPTDNNWNNFNFLYTATSSSVSLSLTPEPVTLVPFLIGDPFAIDNISMEAVPEPSVMSLFCISVLFLHWRMKRSNTALAFIETNWLRPSRLEPI
jgi:hypothetical protein